MSEQEQKPVKAPWHLWIITDILRDLGLGLIYVLPVLAILAALSISVPATVFVLCAAPFVIGFAYALNLLGGNDEEE